MYENKDMLSWLGYFADMMKVSPEKIKMLNICGKQKNVVPTIDTHKRVLIFADQSHEDLLYTLWVLQVMSVQAEMQNAALGMVLFRSRSFKSRARARLAPAESPPSMIWSGA